MTKETLEKFIDQSGTFSEEQKIMADFLVETVRHIDARLETIINNQNNIETAIKNLERYISMMAANYNPIFDLETKD